MLLPKKLSIKVTEAKLIGNAWSAVSRAAGLDIGHVVATQLQEGWCEASIAEKAGSQFSGLEAVEGGFPQLKLLLHFVCLHRHQTPCPCIPGRRGSVDGRGWGSEAVGDPGLVTHERVVTLLSTPHSPTPSFCRNHRGLTPQPPDEAAETQSL